MTDERVASPLRLTLVGMVIAALAAGSSLLSVRIAVGPDRDTLLALAPANSEVVRRERAVRGTITDRNGTILAVTVARYRLVRDRILPAADAERAAVALAPLLAIERDALARTLASTDRIYQVLSGTLSEATEESVRAVLGELGLSGLRLEERAVRLYPQSGGIEGTTLASTLLGFVNGEGAGQYGVEEALDGGLGGTDFVFREMRSAAGGAVPGSRVVIDPGTPGRNVALTIDATLQARLETLANLAASENGARVATIAVLDPNTGELLAVASSGGFDANRYGRAAGDLSVFVNTFSGEVYAPGSVMKSVTAAAAIDAGVASPATILLDTASISLDGGRASVENANYRGMGSINLADALAYSRNVATTRLALLLGSTTQARAEALYGTWARLGLAGASGGDLFGEAAGLARDPSKNRWAEIDLSNASFGQGVSVTALQLVAAYGAMVNGGVLVRPKVTFTVAGVPTPIVVRGSAMRAETSAAMADLLRHIIEENYRSALVPGYLVGGKTGTAQVWDPALGTFDRTRLDFSLVGFVEDGSGRRLAVSISVRDGTKFNPTTSAPVYRTSEIMADTVRAIVETLGLPPIRTLDGELWRQERDLDDRDRAPVTP